MEIVDPSHDDRKRALLLHYCGEKVYDIYIAEKGTSGNNYTDVKKGFRRLFQAPKEHKWKFTNFARADRKKSSQSMNISQNCVH